MRWCPQALRLAIRRRAARLAGAGHVGRFLDVAAVLGERVDVGVLAAVLDQPVLAVAAAADRAVDAGILRPVGPDYAFVHAVIREAIYSDLRPAARRGWHLAVAHELAARDAHPAVVAHHFLTAWPTGSADAAAEYCLRAGDQAMRSLAAEDAVTHYRSALTALARSPHDRRRDRCTTRLAVGAALLASGRLKDVRTEAEDAMALAEQLHDPELTSRAALLGTEHLEFNAVDHDAIAMLRRADAAWREARSLWRARVLARLAVATATSDGAAADAAAEHAEAMAGQAGDAATLAAALSARLHADWGRHDPESALRAARRIQDLVPESVDGHLWSAVFALECGRLDVAEAAVAEVARLGSDLRRPSIGHLALSRRSTLAAVRGDLDRALELATQAWQLGRRCGLPDADAVYWGQLFVVWRKGRLDDERARRMETIVTGLVEHSPLRMVHEAALVQMLHARGHEEQARRRYDDLVALVPTLAYDMVRVFSLVLMAENCLLFGDARSARMLHDALVPYADRWAVAAGAVACLGPVREPLARLAALRTPTPSMLPSDTAATDTSRRIRLDRHGPIWRVSAGQVVVHVPDTRGMGYLAQLVDHPRRDIPAVTLVAGGGETPPGDAVLAHQASMGADAVLDATAKKAYRRRIADLDEEIDQAQSWHDPERLVRLREERDVLVHEITAAFGLGGRPRRLGSEAERARVNVTRAIRTAIRNLTVQAPELGAYLDATVSTGTRCRYDPPD